MGGATATFLLLKTRQNSFTRGIDGHFTVPRPRAHTVRAPRQAIPRKAIDRKEIIGKSQARCGGFAIQTHVFVIGLLTFEPHLFQFVLLPLEGCFLGFLFLFSVCEFAGGVPFSLLGGAGSGGGLFHGFLVHFD